MRLICVMLLAVVTWSGCATRHATPPPGTTSSAKPKRAAPTKAAKKPPTSPDRTSSLTVTNGNQVITLANPVMGKVVSANSVSRFVVLDYSLSRLPALGDRLSIYRQGLKVGEVQVSGPVMNNNVVADLLKGDAQAGDDARKE